ncbi:MAG: hypothetical protein RL385_5699 [Pseudomonadota bacterium]
MSTRQSKGKARTELPRGADLAPIETDPIRTAGRDAAGRFQAANPWGTGAKWRSLIATSLGRELDGRAGELGRRAHRLYRAFLADLPADCASVRSLVAQRARAVALADAYAIRGAELGEGSHEGMECLAEALKWDARAERLAVTSLDISTKFAAKRPPIDAHAAVYAAFGEPVAKGEVKP